MIKGQALADFIAEFTYSNIIEVAGIANNAKAVKEVEMEKSLNTSSCMHQGCCREVDNEILNNANKMKKRQYF